MENITTFRVKDKKFKGNYILKRALASKDGILSYISYRPGAKSIFDEDNQKTAAKSKWVVFKSNNHANNPGVEIRVPNSNGLLLEFLKKHPRFKIDYDVYDENAEADKRVTFYNNMEKAFSYISDSDDDDIRAGALAVLGLNYFGKSASVCRADLKEKAAKEPKAIIDVYEAKDFQMRYLASLLYCKDIIKNYRNNTAIVWSDTENQILAIAKGESGIDKLTEFLSNGTPEAQTLMQEFQARVDRVAKKPADAEKALKNKDAKIAELEARLAALQGASETKDEGEEESPIKAARRQYTEKFGKPVPINKTNNLDWINKELAEGQTV